MSTELTLTSLVADPQTSLKELGPTHFTRLFDCLIAAEHPESFNILFQLMLRTLQKQPELHAAITEAWVPSEAGLARLLEDAGKDAARIVLSLEGVRGELERLWQLCDEIGLANLVSTNDPLEAIALAPMAALYTEGQLDELIAAVGRGRQWEDPAEILSPEGEQEFDLEALIALAQSRMVKTEGGEPLSIVVLRLMDCADRVN